MSANAYHFVTRWLVEGSREEVFDILSDAEGLTRWWPSVYLDIRRIEAGDADGVGSAYDLYTKGWLPYTLRWQLRITERNRPAGFALAASGDFVGRGVWSLEQQGDRTAVTYDWQIRAEKPLLQRLSPLLKPIFSFNHEWAMAQGETSLRLELLRRRATSASEAAAIPPPPGATTTSAVVPLVGIAAGITLGLAALLVVSRRRR